MKKIETKINIGVIMIMLFMLGTLVGTAQVKIMNQLQGNASSTYGKYAVFYAGDACFWCTEGIWDEVPGVVDVESGYLGGTYPDEPTYTSHGDYAEGNKIIYDPYKVSFAELVEYYFLFHSFGKSPDKGKSYRAVIHAENNVEKIVLEYTKAAKANGVFSQQVIIGKVNWFDAEYYHQNYIKRLEAGERVANPGYGRNESIPRRDRALKLIKPKMNTYEEQVILQLPETYSIIKMHHKDHDHMVAEQTKFAYYTLVEEDLINDINYSILLKEFQDCSIKGCGFKNRTVFKDSTLSLYEKFSKVHVDWKVVSKALN